MDVEKLFKEYRNWKGDMGIMEFDLSRSEGTPYDDVIRQLSGRFPEGIWDMVANEMTWRELTEKYNVSETMIAKYRKKAIAEMDAPYRMRAETAESYFLGRPRFRRAV